MIFFWVRVLPQQWLAHTTTPEVDPIDRPARIGDQRCHDVGAERRKRVAYPELSAGGCSGSCGPGRPARGCWNESALCLLLSACVHHMASQDNSFGLGGGGGHNKPSPAALGHGTPNWNKPGRVMGIPEQTLPQTL